MLFLKIAKKTTVNASMCIQRNNLFSFDIFLKGIFHTETNSFLVFIWDAFKKIFNFFKVFHFTIHFLLKWRKQLKMTFFLNGYFFSNTLHISIVHIYNAYINVNCVWGCAHPLRPFRQPTNSSETVQLSSPHTTTTMRRTSVWFEKAKKKGGQAIFHFSFCLPISTSIHLSMCLKILYKLTTALFRLHMPICLTGAAKRWYLLDFPPHILQYLQIKSEIHSFCGGGENVVGLHSTYTHAGEYPAHVE